MITSCKESFLELRRTGIGGSDIGPILGENDYKTAYEVYLEKVEGKMEDKIDKEAMIWGNLLEQPISERYEELTNKHLFSTGTFRHKEYPFLIANPDRIIPMEKHGVEIKTAGYLSKDLWGENGSKEIPTHYYMQIAHYMLVLDYNSWDVAVLIGGQELRVYNFERVKEADEIILEHGTNFWKNHVEKLIPPPLDYSNSRAVELIKKKYKVVSPEIIKFDDELIHWKNVWLESKSLTKRYQTQADMAQAHLLEAMKDAGVGRFNDGSSFVRKLIKAKEYVVKEREYVRLDFKKETKNVNFN